MAEKEVKILYKDIQNILFKIIPEKWDSLYLYASVIYGKGEMYFYYFPKKALLKPKPVNCYEIASKFGINEEQYNKVLNELYNKIKRLNELAIKKWTNITISIVNCLFTVEYNYNDLVNSIYTDEQRHAFWEYKYLKIPIETMSKENQELVTHYNEELKNNSYIYTEGIYIQGKSKTEDKNINNQMNSMQTNDNKITTIDNDKYQIETDDNNQYKINTTRDLETEDNNNEETKEIRNQILKC